MQQSNFNDDNRETSPGGEMMIITGSAGGMKTEFPEALSRTTALDIFKLNCSGENESRREKPICDE